MKKENLTEEEKKARKKEINRRYYENLKKKAAAGDKKALKQKKRNRHKANYNAAKSFIKNEATSVEISELRETIAARVVELRKNKK